MIGITPELCTTSPIDGEPTLAQRIDALEKELGELRAEQRDRADAEFVATLARSVEGRVFSAADLVAHARVDSDLRDALGDERPRQIGRRLARLAGHAVGGVCVRLVDRTNAGRVWAITLWHQDHCDGDDTAR